MNNPHQTVLVQFRRAGSRGPSGFRGHDVGFSLINAN